VSTGAIETASGKFWTYCEELAARGDPPLTFNSVEEYIEQWVLSGRAAKDLKHNYLLFLATISYIFASWHDGRVECGTEERWETIYGAIPWSVTRALKSENYELSTEIFDPFQFSHVGL
jgi:hypothetical protein